VGTIEALVWAGWRHVQYRLRIVAEDNVAAEPPGSGRIEVCFLLQYVMPPDLAAQLKARAIASDTDR